MSKYVVIEILEIKGLGKGAANSDTLPGDMTGMNKKEEAAGRA
jgi:hypothetical protein